MATGDVQDWLGRLGAVEPPEWFPTQGTVQALEPVLTEDGQQVTTESGQQVTTEQVGQPVAPVFAGIMTGLAWIWEQAYSLYAYVANQGRLATTTDTWLDLWAADYFPFSLLQRFTGEGDTAFRIRIRASLLRPKGTRAAMYAAVQALTGRLPWIFEPSNVRDTGGIGMAQCLAWNTAGAWGSEAYPFQCFMQAYRPLSRGIPAIMGCYYGSGPVLGGWGSGAIEWADPSFTAGDVPDSVIQQTVAGTQPAGTVVWLNISS